MSVGAELFVKEMLNSFTKVSLKFINQILILFTDLRLPNWSLPLEDIIIPNVLQQIKRVNFVLVAKINKK